MANVFSSCLMLIEHVIGLRKIALWQMENFKLIFQTCEIEWMHGLCLSMHVRFQVIKDGEYLPFMCLLQFF